MAIKVRRDPLLSRSPRSSRRRYSALSSFNPMSLPSSYQVAGIPKVVVLACYGLEYIRNLIFCVLRFLGLSHRLEYGLSSPYDPTQLPGFKSLSAVLIREILPVVRFGDLAAEKSAHGCVVCLCEIEEDEEIRRLGNCGHVFHRSCLDRWLDCDKQTCPLCRAHLVPKGMRKEFEKKLSAAEEALYLDGLAAAHAAGRISSF